MAVMTQMRATTKRNADERNGIPMTVMAVAMGTRTNSM